MEFEESQFQAAPVAAGEALDAFVAAPGAGSWTSGNAADDFFGSAPAIPAPTAAEMMAADFGVGPDADPVPSVPIDQGAVEDAARTADAPGIADDDPFFQHYTPPAPPPPPPAAPEVVDPRVEWRKQNNEVLKKKDAEEAIAKQKQKETAAQYLAKYYEVRTTTLTQRKANNRKSEAHQKEVEVPTSGTPWEKINGLVNFNSGNHTKDVSRYKALLITCKAKNVPIHAAA